MNNIVVSPELLFGFLITLAFIATVVATYFYRQFVLQLAETKSVTAKFTTKKNEELLVDLELATTDQLLYELKRRPMCPFLLVRPQEQEHMTFSGYLLVPTTVHAPYCCPISTSAT
jgi:hypothetical protein